MEMPGADEPKKVYEVPKYKNMLIKCIIEKGISVPGGTLPADLTTAIKEEMLAGREINFIEILNKIPTPKSKVASLRPIEFIVALSQNGKRLLAHHSEKLTLSVYDAQTGNQIFAVPKHCDCMTPPIHALSADGSHLAFVTHCSKNKLDTLEIFRPDHGEIQTIPLSGFRAESLVLNGDGSVLFCAGGCSSPIQVYQRPNSTDDFVARTAFGTGYMLALNREGNRLAGLTHGELTVYDISALDAPQELYRVYIEEAMHFQFCSGSNDVMILESVARRTDFEGVSASPNGRLRHLVLTPGTFFPSVTMTADGRKIIALVDGKVRFTYVVDGMPEKLLELPKPQHENFNLMQLHDDDTTLTVCTDHVIHRYDLAPFRQVEKRFAKSLPDMAVDDVPVALELLKMSVQEYKQRAQQTTPVAHETAVDREIRKLISPTSNSYEPSLIQRLQLPFLGIATLLLAACAVCN